MATTAPHTGPIASLPNPQNLRWYLNNRVKPYVKLAISKSLDEDPELPLRYIGEYLIFLSLQREANNDPAIANNFMYSFTQAQTPAAPAPSSAPTPPAQNAAAVPLHAGSDSMLLQAQAQAMNGLMGPAHVSYEGSVEQRVAGHQAGEAEPDVQMEGTDGPPA